MSRLFWVSWYQPTDDYRPLTFPPNEAILGWWCSGEGAEGHTLCAMLFVKDEAAAEKAVRQDWPEFSNWRFIEKRDTAALTDRFPINQSWMTERFQGHTDQPSVTPK